MSAEQGPLTTEHVCEDFAAYHDQDWQPGEERGMAMFERWIKAHDEAIRADEREKCIAIADTVAKLHDGKRSEYHEGWRDGADAVGTRIERAGGEL